MSGFCTNFCNDISRCCYDFYHTPFTKKNLMIGGGVILGLIIIIIIIVCATRSGSSKPETGEDLLKMYPLVDGANSLAYNIKQHFIDELSKMDNNKLSQNLSAYFSSLPCDMCQTDFYRLKAGHVATQVFSVSSDCNAQYKDSVSQTLEQIDLIKRLIAEPANKLALVTQSEDIHKHFNAKTTGVIINVWGGHNIDSRLAVLRMYYDLGVRMMSLAVTNGNDLCSPPWISGSNHTKFGQKVVSEMNRLGMIIDLTGCPNEVQQYVLAYTNAPVIFSHSGSYTSNGNPLNVDDNILKNKKVGLVMVPFDACQLISNCSAQVDTVVDHLNKLTSAMQSTTHLGIGSNFDYMTKTVNGLSDVSTFPRFFNELLSKGWSPNKLRGLAGENFINVFKEVEKASNSSRAADDSISPKSDYPVNSSCYSDFHMRYNKTDPTPKPKTLS